MPEKENKLIFKATPQFWKSFNALPLEKQKQAKEAFKVFQNDPTDPSLKIHKINRLTAIRKWIVRSIVIGNDLRAVFEVHGNTIITLDIGNHDIYK